MNRLIFYIAIWGLAFLVSCAQQSESTMEDVSSRDQQFEEIDQQQAYYWEQETALYTGDKDIELRSTEENKNGFDEIESQKNSNEIIQATNEESATLTGNATEKVNLETEGNGEQNLMKAFVKQHIEDLLDLGAIYENADDNNLVKASVKSEMMQVLSDEDFSSFHESLFFDKAMNKKISFEELELHEDGTYAGVIQIVSAGKFNKIAFQVISEEMEYGTSRKFEILGITYELK